MSNQREILKTLLLAKVPGSEQTILHLDPLVLRIEEEIQWIVQNLPIQPLIANKILPGGLTTGTVYELLFKAIQKILDNSSPADLTIDSVAKSLGDQSQLPIVEPAASECISVLEQLAIAFVGMITLLFSWHEAPLSNYCSIKGGPSSQLTNLHLENCSRSIGSFIRHLGLLPSPYSKDPWPENLLVLSILNFHSLTHIGRIHIEWVPHISQHLILHIPTTTLRLFKYPSMCALVLLGGDYQKIDHRILHNGYYEPLHSIHREVLLSLRFILGQTRKSRRLAHRLAFASLKPEERDKGFDMLLQGKLDRLLYTPSSPSANLAVESPIDQDFLTPWSDFPLLGERMLEIQGYNAKQQPTKTSKMIRDKRDPARWYTLWVVLLVGGLSVVLSLMQLAVSFAQLAYAIHPVNPSP